MYVTLQKLRVKDCPRYEGREYEEHGTERCEVTVYIEKSEEFSDLTEAWSMTATGFRFVDTYQVVARKALRYLCQIYEEPIARTPMWFFPPLDRNRRAWRARMEALQGRDAQEDSPTMVHLTTYLLALDEQYDRQALELRACLRRAEEAEVFNQMLQVQLAEAHASAVAAESREATMEESLKEAEDQHVHQLGEAYLFTRARRRSLVDGRQDAPILEGIPLHPSERRRTGDAEPPAPPPSEVLEAEPLIPLTQPLPQEDVE